MTTVIVCRAPREDVSAHRLLGIYRTEPTRRLTALLRALTTERDAPGQTPDVIAWCDRRIPLVAQVLKDREP